MGESSVNAFLASRFTEVSPLVFYRELFPSGELDSYGSMTPGKYCGIAVQVVGRGKNAKAKRYTICDDLSPIAELINAPDFVVISPVSYAGKTQAQSMARNLYALVFDLDALISMEGRQSGLEDLLHQASHGLIPMPTYIVSSGTGIHLYYLMESPLPLFDNVLKQLRAYRTELTKKLWNRYTTTLWEHPQFESVTQGFRAVGSCTKSGDERVRAFLTGSRVSMDYMNKFVSEKSRVVRFSYKSSLTRAQAAERYPEWYESRIVSGNPKGTWTVKRDLYDWWKRKIREGATVGHRYFCIMCLAVYARKCGVSKETLEADAFDLLPFLEGQTIQEDNHFDESDVVKALEAYEASYITFPRRSIQELTAIEIPPNKRNGRKQSDHLKIARAVQSIYRELGETEKGGGRPSKEALVLRCVEEHPEFNVSQVAKHLGISWNTAKKYMK